MSEREHKENSFKESIDHIEPSDGAKERMLQNIRRKAAKASVTESAQEVKTAKILPFNKIIKWALPIAACFVFILVGISVIPNLEFGNPGIQIPNPLVEVQSSEEFIDRLGISIEAPDGSENVKYYVFDKSIAQIDFEHGGNDFTLRASKQSGDFSGIYGTVIKYDKIDAENDAVLETIKGIEMTFLKMTWTDGAATYILFNNSEASAEDIFELYELLK